MLRALGVRLIAIEEVRNHERIVYIKNIFENGWWEDTYPSFYSLYPPLTISYRNHQKSLAYFSHLPPLILFFLLKDKVKRRGAWPSAPSFSLCPLVKRTKNEAIAIKSFKMGNSLTSTFYPKICAIQ